RGWRSSARRSPVSRPGARPGAGRSSSTSPCRSGRGSTRRPSPPTASRPRKRPPPRARAAGASITPCSPASGTASARTPPRPAPRRSRRCAARDAGSGCTRRVPGSRSSGSGPPVPRPARGARRPARPSAPRSGCGRSPCPPCPPCRPPPSSCPPSPFRPCRPPSRLPPSRLPPSRRSLRVRRPRPAAPSADAGPRPSRPPRVPVHGPPPPINDLRSSESLLQRLVVEVLQTIAGVQGRRLGIGTGGALSGPEKIMSSGGCRVEALRPEDPRGAGAYRLIARLGAGGMGRVFLGRSARGRMVAVKLVHPELARDPDFRRRFRHEVEAARRVGGEWTAAVLDADTDSETPWVATAYVPGPSLQEVVDLHGPLPEASVLALAGALARALQAVHGNDLIHRDLKPSNVLVTIDGPRLIDFGIARSVDTGVATRTGTLIGSPGYMSPEQVRGAPLTPASDVFSLGAVLAYAATGRPPFGGGEGGVHAQ